MAGPYHRMRGKEMTTKKQTVTVKRVIENGDYLCYKDGKVIGGIFRTGFGGNEEWTCADFINQHYTAHPTKRSAVTQIRFTHGVA